MLTKVYQPAPTRGNFRGPAVHASLVGKGRLELNRSHGYQPCALTIYATFLCNKAENIGAAYGEAFAVICLIVFFVSLC